MTTDAGLQNIFEALLCRSKSEGKKYIAENVGADYLQIVERVHSRWKDDKRSLNANALYWEWVSQVAKHQGETKEDTHREAKLSLGCPILFRDNEKFADFYRRIIAPLPREDRLAAMDFIDVSSVMTTRQMVEFMDEFEKKWRMRGVRLTIPEPSSESQNESVCE